MVSDSLKELSYEARRAGMFYQLFSGNKGFGVSVNGYEDKLHVFLMQVLHKFRNLKINKDKLAYAKEEVSVAHLDAHIFILPIPNIFFHTGPEAAQELPIHDTFPPFQLLHQPLAY